MVVFATQHNLQETAREHSQECQNHAKDASVDCRPEAGRRDAWSDCRRALGFGRDGAQMAGASRLRGRVSDLLCMSKLAHASATQEHENDEDFQGTFRLA
jgi:hypothetical protein